MKTAFSGKAPRGNKEKISTLIRLMTENSTIIKTKFTPSLTSNDTNISRWLIGDVCKLLVPPFWSPLPHTRPHFRSDQGFVNPWSYLVMTFKGGHFMVDSNETLQMFKYTCTFVQMHVFSTSGFTNSNSTSNSNSNSLLV